MDDAAKYQTKTPEQRLAELVEEDSHSGGRKLKFHDQCAAFAALYGGTKNRIVSRAFGVSPTTVSHIAGCLEYDPTPYQRKMVYDRDRRVMVERTDERDHNKGRSMNRERHYEAVAREFEALGMAEFNERYLTQGVLDRLELARSQLRREKKNPPAKPYREPVRKRPEDMSTDELIAWYAEHPDQDPRKDHIPT